MLKILGRDGLERPFPVNIQYCVSSTRLLTSSVLVGAGSSKRGRLVEWVEKTSFARLKRLLEITTSKKKYQTLLLAQNLLAVVREPQPYVLNILPRQLPKVVVPREHFVLRDLPFYEEAREADEKACQKRLGRQEERRQEGTLWRAPGEKGRVPLSVPCPSAEKKRKRNLVKVIKAPTLAPISPSTTTSSTLDSSAHAFEGTSSSSRLDPGDPGPRPSNPNLEPLALVVIDKPGVEKVDMSPDLRVSFEERHRKRLYETIDIVPPSAKRACPERAREETERKVPLVPLPPLDVTRSNCVAAIKEKADPTPSGASSSVAPTERVSNPKDTSVPPFPSQLG